MRITRNRLRRLIAEELQLLTEAKKPVPTKVVDALMDLATAEEGLKGDKEKAFITMWKTYGDPDSYEQDIQMISMAWLLRRHPDVRKVVEDLYAGKLDRKMRNALQSKTAPWKSKEWSKMEKKDKKTARKIEREAGRAEEREDQGREDSPSGEAKGKPPKGKDPNVWVDGDHKFMIDNDGVTVLLVKGDIDLLAKDPTKLRKGQRGRDELIRRMGENKPTLYIDISKPGKPMVKLDPSVFDDKGDEEKGDEEKGTEGKGTEGKGAEEEDRVIDGDYEYLPHDDGKTILIVKSPDGATNEKPVEIKTSSPYYKAIAKKMAKEKPDKYSDLAKKSSYKKPPASERPFNENTTQVKWKGVTWRRSDYKGGAWQSWDTSDDAGATAAFGPRGAGPYPKIVGLLVTDNGKKQAYVYRKEGENTTKGWEDYDKWKGLAPDITVSEDGKKYGRIPSANQLNTRWNERRLSESHDRLRWQKLAGILKG